MNNEVEGKNFYKDKVNHKTTVMGMRIHVLLQNSMLSLLLVVILGFIPETMQAVQGQSTAQIQKVTLSEAQQNFYKAEIEQEISVEFEKVTLGDALKHIARETNLKLTYRGDIIVDKNITFQRENISVNDVLEFILEGSGLDFNISENGYLLIRSAIETADVEFFQNSIRGTITDRQNGETLPGVNILVKGTNIGTATDLSGEFELTVSSLNDTLIVSYIGYLQQEIPINGRTEIDVDLTSHSIVGEELVVVGYGTRSRETLSGSVSSVSVENLERAPVSNLSHSLAGQIPGLVSVTPTGEPGNDGSNILIRGLATLGDNAPLIVIDGVPNRAGGFERLNPRDIESLSVLKDASAAIYGAQAANGVILITTKRGQVGAPQITVDIDQGINRPTRIPEMADAATYMTMLNEIDVYRDRPPNFSEERIRCHAEQSDPWKCPDTDWFAESLKPMSFQSQATMSVSGGGEAVRYFVSLGALTEDGFYRNSATRYNQYNFRSNIDGQLSDNVSVTFDVSGRLEDRNYPNVTTASTFRMLVRGKPHLPAYWPNGKPAPDIEHGHNPVVTGTTTTGYNKQDSYYFQSNLGLNIEIPAVDGLSFRGNFSFDRNNNTRRVWEVPWVLYSWDYESIDENGDPILSELPRGNSEPRLTQRQGESNDIMMNLLINYQFDLENHSIGALLGAERQTFQNHWFEGHRRYFSSDRIEQLFAGSSADQTTTGSADQGIRQNYFTRINYGYRSKYLFEFVGRYDGSYIFPEEGRFGFFPGGSVAWRISQEDWFRDITGFFNELKLRSSYGLTGNDRIDAFQYMSTFMFGNGYIFADDVGSSISQTRVPNPQVTWEIARQFDIGIESSILDNRLSVEFDYYNYLRSDILWLRNASVPLTTGFSLPEENIGEVASWGIDGSINYQDQVTTNILLNVTLNGSWGKNEIKFWDEAPGAPEWQRSTGAPMNTGLYYNAIGIFQSEEEIENTPSWPNARPGDIIFEDVNGDGVIDGQDRVRQDKNEIPRYTGGLNIGVAYKGLEINAFFQGAMGAVQYIVNRQSGEYGNYFKEFADNRWTSDNPSAEYPRSFSREDEYWIRHDNTFYLRNADYIRLKNLEIGYYLPFSIIDNLGINSFRIYASGHNLLTWDTLKIADPETRNAQAMVYPQKSVFNLGLSVMF